MIKNKFIIFLRKYIVFVFVLLNTNIFSQYTTYISSFDYQNINKATLLPINGYNNEQMHYFTLLKHSFEYLKIVNHPNDTTFHWNGLRGQKTIYSKDSLVLFFLRPDDNVNRACILLTHGNNAGYKNVWNETTTTYAIDLAMRGFCVAYYENPSSFNSNNRFSYASTRNAFYGGFQSAVAASSFIIANASPLQVDTSKLFAGGLSFGAFCSLALATADAEVNFKDSIFAGQGNFSDKSLYPIPYTKIIKRVFSIGGGLPKDDTLMANNSYMGNFIDDNDANLSMLFLHGRTDNFVSFDLSLFGTSGYDSTLFYTEGPRSIINNIAKNNLAIDAKIIVNCRGGHTFVTTVCNDTLPNCIQQYQWSYLTEPPSEITSSDDEYFMDSSRDTLLHYFVYMMTQTNDLDYIIGDFLQPSTNNKTSILNHQLYFVQPSNPYSYSIPTGYYFFKNSDCEGNVISANTLHTSTQQHLKIYPNPAQDFIYIDTDEPITFVNIYSILGNLITSAGTVSSIYVGDLPKGNYLMVIQLKNHREAIKFSIMR